MSGRCRCRRKKNCFMIGRNLQSLSARRFHGAVFLLSLSEGGKPSVWVRESSELRACLLFKHGG